MTKMTFITAAALALVPATAALAEPSAPISFDHQGYSYTYTVDQKADTRIIRGVVTNTGKPFTLYVAKSRVSGFVDGQPVSFPLSAVKPLHGTVDVTVASR